MADKDQKVASLPVGGQEIRREDDRAFLARLQPMLAEIETFRLQTLGDIKKCRRNALVGFAAMVLFALVLCAAIGLRGMYLCFTAPFFYWYATSFGGGYARFYKKKIMPAIASALGFLRYEMHGEVDIAEMTPSGLIPTHDMYVHGDYFEGVYKGARIRFCTANFRQLTAQSYTTVFDGLVVLADLARARFSSKTIVVHYQSAHTAEKMEQDLGMESVDFLDTAFKRQFTVYTTDQVEARYLIDEAVAERMESLPVAFGSADVRMSYFDNKVLLMAQRSGRGMFEAPPVSQDAHNAEGILNIKRDVEAALGLIDRVDRFIDCGHAA